MRVRLSPLLFLIVATLPATAFACAGGEEPIAKLYFKKGDVRIDGQLFPPTDIGHPVCFGQTIETGPVADATISHIATQTVGRLGPNSRLQVIVAVGADRGAVTLLQGTFYLLSRVRRSFDIDTPFVNASIEGTEVVFTVAGGDPGPTGERLRITVLEGGVAAAPKGDTRIAPGTVVTSGQRLVVDAENRATVTDPGPGNRFAVLREAGGRELAWTLYYPAVLPHLPRELAPALAALRAGRLDAARTALAEIDDSSPAAADRDAVSSIAALVLSDRGEALRLADRAVSRAPDAASGRLARSWALQVGGDFDGALEEARRAAAAAPESALARARVAEVLLMRGDTAAARREADAAAAIGPDPGAFAVQGFAALAGFDTAAADAAFTRALRLDPGDPTARMGQGLVRIRTGDLAGGRQLLEVASIQDPTRSVLRAQLGRALMAEGRGERAAIDLEVARELDPTDPTPWLYEAQRLQQANRPIEALAAAQRSLALNDQRAPFRAPGLLDEDRAVRGAVLGRILQDLGFEQLGLPIASRALSDDPTSGAAHRFLADVYAGLPRREVARVSEEFVARLLHGPTAEPIRPSRRFPLLSRAGPVGSRLGFNEFTRATDSDGLQAIVSGLVGDRSTYVGEAAVGARLGRGSLSVGQLRSDTNGFRENAHVRQDVTSMESSAQLSETVSALVEFRHGDSLAGDLEQRFDLEDYSLTNFTSLQENVARIGFRWNHSSNAILLVTGALRDIEQTNSVSEARATGRKVEAAEIYRNGPLALIVGGAHISADRTLEVGALSIPVEPERQTTAYLYSHARLGAGVDATSAMSIDDSTASAPESAELNPKFGLVWQPIDAIKLRVAYLEWTQRDFVMDETLEPTEVAGFGQLYDDSVGTQVRLYGLGLDARIGQGLLFGAGAGRRELTTPNLGSDGVSFLQAQENWLDLYLSGTLGLRWTVDIRYEYEWYRDSGGFTENPAVPRRVTTQQVPLTLRYFDASGWYASLRTTWLWQDVDAAPGANVGSGGSDVVLFDLGVGYRLLNESGRIELRWHNVTDQSYRFRDYTTRSTRNLEAGPDAASTIFLTASFRFG